MAKSNNPFDTLSRSVPPPMRNRYFLCLIVFFAWLIFFDKHDLLTQWRLANSVERLEYDKTYFQAKIKDAKERKADIERNQEKFARERYYMHKNDEEVFIIVKEGEE